MPDWLLSSLIILLAFTVYAVLHSLLASLRAKALAEQWFGIAVRRWYRLGYVLFVSATLLPIVGLTVLLPAEMLYSIPMPWVIGTVLIQALAVVGVLVVVRQTGASRFLGFAQLSEPAERVHPPDFVAHSWYARVRHPLYLFSLIVIWLTPLMTTNILALNLGMTAYFLIGSIFEENKLVHEFGESYRRYRQSTPRLLPRLKR